VVVVVVVSSPREAGVGGLPDPLLSDCLYGMGLRQLARADESRDKELMSSWEREC
jgi:hypothetical protein